MGCWCIGCRGGDWRAGCPVGGDDKATAGPAYPEGIPAAASAAKDARMPIAEITRSETRERARLLRVDDYDVALDLTRGPDVFGSTSVIRFSCTQPGASTYADLVAETVHEIMLNGVSIDPAGAWADGRIALTGLAPQRAAGRRRLPLRQHRRGHAPRGRLGRREGVHVHELRARRRAQGVRELRAARPEGRVHLPRHRPGALDCAVEPAGPAARGRRRRHRALALPGHAADLHVPDRGRRRRVPPGPRHAHRAHRPGDPARRWAAGPRSPGTSRRTTSSRSPSRASTSSPASSGPTSRSPSTTRSSCPSSAAGAMENVGLRDGLRAVPVPLEGHRH